MFAGMGLSMAGNRTLTTYASCPAAVIVDGFGMGKNDIGKRTGMIGAYSDTYISTQPQHLLIRSLAVPGRSVTFLINNL
jgi:hypothetical protein